jgi:hypothetical protein
MQLNIGGSAIKTASDEFTHGFFHNGVKSQMFRTDSVYDIRILPSFDYSIPDTSSPEFRQGYLPYMDQSIAEVEGKQVHNSWFYTIIGYTFYGTRRASLVSPLTGGPIRTYGQSRRGVCPINDVYNYVMASEELKNALTVRRDKKSPPPVVKPKYFILMNILAKDPNKDEEEFSNKIGIFSGAANTALEKTISLKQKNSKGEVNYVYGDFTDPATGLMAHVKSTPIEGNPTMSFSGISFTKDPTMLFDTTPWPIDMESKDGKAMLENRYNVQDTNSVLKYTSYEQALESLVDNTDVPYEIIEKACAPYLEVGVSIPQRTGPTAVSSVEAIKPVDEGSTLIQSELPMSSAVSAINKADDDVPFNTKPEDVVETVSSSDMQDSTETERWESLNNKYHNSGADEQSKITVDETQEYFILSSKLGKDPANVPAG